MLTSSKFVGFCKAAGIWLLLIASAIGGILAIGWGIVAGLWSFGTRDYLNLAGVLLVAGVLAGAPLLGFVAMANGKRRVALIAVVPSLLVYAVLAVALLR